MKLKLIFSFLLATLLLSVLASCGQGTVPPPQTPGFVPPEKPDVAPISVAFADASVTKAGNIKMLDDDTVLLAETGAATSLSFTVNAPEAGYYMLDLYYNIGGGYLQYLYLYNDSYPEWGGYGEGRIGTSKSIPADDIEEKDYRVRNASLRVRFDEIPEAYVYLKKGENALRMYTGGSLTNTMLGVKEARLIPVRLLLDNQYTSIYTVSDFKTESGYQNHLTDQSSLSNNGYFLRSGSYVYIDVTVEEDGQYAFSGLISSDATVLSISSPSGNLAPIKKEYTPIKIGDSSTSVTPIEFGSLNLSAGTHTLKIETTGGWFHFNMLALEKIADFSTDVSLYTKKSNFQATRDKGEFTYDLFLEAMDPVFPETRLSVVLTGLITKNDGTQESIRKTYDVSGFENTVTLSAGPFSNFKKGSFEISIYNANNASLISSEGAFTIDTADEFRAYLLTDTHYTGTNEQQKIYYPDTGSDHTHAGGLKAYNGYTAEYDIYGWTSDEKLQRIIDDLTLKYLAGELDLIFFLGDTAMNDGNYYNFNPDHVHYDNGNVVLENGVKVPDTYKGSGATHYGVSMEDFKDNPLNVSYTVKKKFLDQLSSTGIPYFCANGNHDYLMNYNKNKTDIDYTLWEDTYHYAELFGHKNKNGRYIDTTSVDYLVRVIRRNGEIKILSALTSSELAAFKERNKNDGNCYDFYVSEDSLTDSDERLAAFIMVNGHQWESFKNYYEFYTTNGSWGQTIRYEYLREDIIDAMTGYIKEYPSVYFLGHMVQASPAIAKAAKENPNIRGIFYGDAHYEVRSTINGLPAWCVGHRVTDFDIDMYYVRDPETGEYALDANGNKIPDNQYYYDRGNPKVANRVWGDFSRHPYCFMTLEVDGSLSYAERNHYTMYYENGYQSLTKDWVRGWDPNYLRASDNTLAEGTHLTVGNRTVYIGSDATTRGTAMAYIGTSYVPNACHEPAYIIKVISGTSYGLYTLSGAPVMEGADQKTVTVSSYTEGTAFQMDGTTYYVLSKVASVYGHYYYDERGEYVYETVNGGYAFYDFYRDADGDLVKEYFYLNENDEFVSLGKWNADHTVYTLRDGIYTDIRLYKENDGSFGKGSKYHVESAVIEIENGVIVRGEGFMNFSYAHRFVDEYGNEVAEEDVKRADDKLGIYIPQEGYLGEYMLR